MNPEIKSNAPAIVVVGKAKQGEPATGDDEASEESSFGKEIILGTPEDAPKVTLNLPSVPAGLEVGKALTATIKLIPNSISGNDVEISLLSITPTGEVDDEDDRSDSQKSQDQLDQNFEDSIPADG